LICDRVALARAKRNAYLIADLRHSVFVVGDHQWHRGYALVLLTAHVREPFELPEDVQREHFGEVMRAAEGPLANVRGEAPDELEYRGSARPLREVWVALRNNVRGILDDVTLADVIADRIPSGVKEMGKKPDLRAY
jgi:hypothetical protein